MKSLLKIGLVLFCLFALFGCGSENATSSTDGLNNNNNQNSGGKVYEWTLGTIHYEPSSLPEFNSYGYALEKFVELVDEKTNGRVKITPFWASSIGGDVEMFQRVMAGDLDIHYGMPMANADPRLGAWELPYLVQDLDHAKEIVNNPESEFFKLSQQWYKDNNIVLLASGLGSIRGIVNGGQQVITPEDANNLKLRVTESPIATTFWESISIATPLPASEIYMALETKAIDGLEFHASGVVGQQYYNIVDYYTDINWRINFAANIHVSASSWEKLPDDLKAAVEEAAWEAMYYHAELEIDDYNKAIDELKNKGMQVYELSDEERQAWIDYARSLDEKLKSIIGEDVFNQVMEIVKR